MVLEALELQLRTEKSEDVTLPAKLTIKQVLPRRWKQYWPIPEDVEDSTEFRQNRDVLKHTIENSTLLTKKLDPSVSNKAWNKNQPAIQKHTLLRMNNDLIEYEEWDEETISDRADSLFKTACEI